MNEPDPIARARELIDSLPEPMATTIRDGFKRISEQLLVASEQLERRPAVPDDSLAEEHARGAK